MLVKLIWMCNMGWLAQGQLCNQYLCPCLATILYFLLMLSFLQLQDVLHVSYLTFTLARWVRFSLLVLTTNILDWLAVGLYADSMASMLHLVRCVANLP